MNIYYLSWNTSTKSICYLFPDEPNYRTRLDYPLLPKCLLLHHVLPSEYVAHILRNNLRVILYFLPDLPLHLRNSDIPPDHYLHGREVVSKSFNQNWELIVLITSKLFKIDFYGVTVLESVIFVCERFRVDWQPIGSGVCHSSLCLDHSMKDLDLSLRGVFVCEH